MKSIRVFLLLVVLLPSAAHAQWLWVQKHPIRKNTVQYTFTSFAWSGHICTAAGIEDLNVAPFMRAIFLRSTDDGDTWSEQFPDTARHYSTNLRYVRRVCQLDDLHTFAVGDSGLFVKTTDGGVTWNEMDLPTSQQLMDVSFSSPDTGMVIAWGFAGVKDQILETYDGGAHWRPIRFAFNDYPLFCHSYGRGKFLVGTGNVLYRTTDDWSRHDSILLPRGSGKASVTHGYFSEGGSFALTGIRYVTDSTPQVGYLLYTSDAGAHWIDVPQAGVFGKSVQCVSEPDRDTIIAGGSSPGHYIISHNHGSTWTVDTLITDKSLTAMQCMGFHTTTDGHAVGLVANLEGTLATAAILKTSYQPAAAVTDSYERLQSLSRVYPNPATSTVNVTTPEPLAALKLVDVMGREVLRSETDGRGDATLNTLSLSAGVYRVLLSRDGLWVPVSKIVVLGQ